MNLQVQQNMNNQTTLQYKWSNQVTYGHPQESHGAVAQLDDTGRGLSGNIRHPEGCLWKNNNNYCKIASSNTSRLEAHVGDFLSLCTVTF